MLRGSLLNSVFLLALCTPLPSAACIAGTTYEKDVGPFEASMSYDAYRIDPGQSVRFHFDLNNLTHPSYGPGNPIDFEFVRVTFRDGDVVVHSASAQRIDFGEAAFDYVVPERNDDYVVDVRFERKGEEIASLALPLRVGWGDLWRLLWPFGRPDAGLLRDVRVSRS